MNSGRDAAPVRLAPAEADERTVYNQSSTGEEARNVAMNAPVLWTPELELRNGAAIYGNTIGVALNNALESYPDACLVPYVCDPPRRLGVADADAATIAWVLIDIDSPRRAWSKLNPGKAWADAPADNVVEHTAWLARQTALADSFEPAPAWWLSPNEGLRLAWAAAPGSVTARDYNARCRAFLERLRVHGFEGIDASTAEWTRQQRLPRGAKLHGWPSYLVLPPAPSGAELATRGPVRTSAASAVTETVLFRMWEAAGLPFGDVAEHRADVPCLWSNEHSDPDAPISSSTSILADVQGKGMGVFKCQHGHCAHRGNAEVLAELSKDPAAKAVLAAHDAAHDVEAKKFVGEHVAAPGAHPSEDYTGLRLNPLTGWPWILQKDRYYWLHEVDKQQYRQEVPAGELLTAVARDLSHQISNEKDRTQKELHNRWTKNVALVRATYTARAHTYDPDARALTLAALRWTSLEPKFHADIDRWLRALFGSSYDAAAQWIASLQDLSRPAPCLYMAGARELGKSLLASGLSTLWSVPQPATLAEVISDFNEATGHCPLVFSDEGFPPGLNFNDFREMITAHARRVNEKHRAKVTVEGCCRAIIAANNDDALRYQKTGTLTKDDLDAIADRLLVIVCSDAARAEVRKLDTDDVARRTLAEHALWIAKEVPMQPKGQRMAAAPGGGERILQNVMAGRHAEILMTVRSLLEQGQSGGSGIFYDERKHPGRTLVHIERLFRALPLGHKTSVADVREFCATHQVTTAQHHPDGKGGPNLMVRVLDTASLTDALARLD